MTIPDTLHSNASNSCQLYDKWDIRRFLNWYRDLQQHRGWRAELRRPTDVNTLAVCHACLQLQHLFARQIANIQWRWKAVVMMAGAAAHVRHDLRKNDDKTDENKWVIFARQLGTPKPGKNHPALSRLRFDRLNNARHPEEFYRLLLMAIHQLDGTTSLLSVADTILSWWQMYDELQQNPAAYQYISPFDNPKIRMARDYFHACQKYPEQPDNP